MYRIGIQYSSTLLYMSTSCTRNYEYRTLLLVLYWAVWSRPFFLFLVRPGCVLAAVLAGAWGFGPRCGVARPRSAFCVCRPFAPGPSLCL